MAGHPIISVGGIARETGLSRQRVWQLAVSGRIPAKQANPNGKQHRFYDSEEFAAWRKQQADRRAAKPAIMTRTQRIGRRRRERANRLFEIIEEKKAVDPSDKDLACQYVNIMLELVGRQFLEMLGRQPLPLLEGVHALVESKFFRTRGALKPGFPDPVPAAQMLEYLRKQIRELPTQTSRPRSSAASD